MTNLFFLINACAVLLVLLFIGVSNLFRRERISINYRLGALCLSLIATGFVYIFNIIFSGFPSILYFAIFAYGCWTTTLLYLSFLVDMTAVRRSRFFPVLYVFPAPLAILSMLLPRPYGLFILVVVGVGLVCGYSLKFLLFWIRTATDDRARRDGEWMFIMFIFFTFGAIVAFFHTPSGFYWVLAFWIIMIHFAVNHLGIYRNLTNTENKLILDNVFDIIIILDPKGVIVRMNRRGYHITELSSNAVIGSRVEFLVKHQELSAYTRKTWLADHAWIDAGGQNRRSPSIDAALATRGGEEIPVDLRIVCLVDLSHDVTGYIISASDMRITRQLIKEISDREYAARDLALSENKFSRMFIFNPSGILILSMDTFLITDANPAMEEILESDANRLAGKTIESCGIEFLEMSIGVFSELIKAEGSVSEFSARVVLRDNSIKKCRVSAVAFELNDTTRVLLSASDVTVEEEMREALMRKQKVETIGILAGGIAHDFNNILAVILGHVGLAKMRAMDADLLDPIERAEKACLRAREITGQLLAFSRGGSPILGVHDTQSVITEFATFTVANTSVACSFNFEPDILPMHVDRVQIGQVISNLVKNAAEAMNNSGIIDIRCVSRDYRNASYRERPAGIDSKPIKSGLYIEIRLRDQGSGISKAALKKMYDPFFSTKKKGSGLGLSIVYSIIQNHGGAISVVSQPGQGTTFTVLLPALEQQLFVSEKEIRAPLEGNKRILVMDDDQAVLETATVLLESFGYIVDVAINGEEGVLKYKNSLEKGTKYHACILDLIIPDGMSGIQCAKEILQYDPNAVLIVSSGYSDDPVMAHWQEYGFRAVIKKPYTLNEIRDVLVNVLVK